VALQSWGVNHTPSGLSPAVKGCTKVCTITLSPNFAKPHVVRWHFWSFEKIGINWFNIAVEIGRSMMCKRFQYLQLSFEFVLSVTEYHEQPYSKFHSTQLQNIGE